jgi:hypothetical protein
MRRVPFDQQFCGPPTSAMPFDTLAGSSQRLSATSTLNSDNQAS